MRQSHLTMVGTAVLVAALAAHGRDDNSPDDLYRQREDVSHAVRAAELWARRADMDFESAWKLARACYWLGRHQPVPLQRGALERGVAAGETASRLAPNRPEGHFWLAADMGRLADSLGVVPALKYRGRIKAELERVLAIEPSWQGGAADEALGEWYATVPRLFGGSRQSAERHLRRALDYDANNLSALAFLGEWLVSEGRTDEARAFLRRALTAASDPEWAPEDREVKQRAMTLLKRIGS